MEGSRSPRFIVYPTFQLSVKLYLYIYMTGLPMSSRLLLTTSLTSTHPLTMSHNTKDYTRLPRIYTGMPSMVFRLPLGSLPARAAFDESAVSYFYAYWARQAEFSAHTQHG
jgi:hypothetical protein